MDKIVKQQMIQFVTVFSNYMYCRLLCKKKTVFKELQNHVFPCFSGIVALSEIRQFISPTVGRR